MNEQQSSTFKYGGHMYMWLERWSDDHLGLLNHIRDLDLDLFEVSLGDDSQISPQKLRHAAESLDLELTVEPGAPRPRHSLA